MLLTQNLKAFGSLSDLELFYVSESRWQTKYTYWASFIKYCTKSKNCKYSEGGWHMPLTQNSKTFGSFIGGCEKTAWKKAF